MSWAEMVPDGGQLPSLKQVHANFVEDGLNDSDQYTLYDPEGRKVYSDRCLNHRLRRSLKKGVTEEEWNVVIKSRPPVLWRWSEG